MCYVLCAVWVWGQVNQNDSSTTVRPLNDQPPTLFLNIRIMFLNSNLFEKINTCLITLPDIIMISCVWNNTHRVNEWTFNVFLAYSIKSISTGNIIQMIHNNNKCQNWIDFVKVEVYSWSLSLNLKKQSKSNQIIRKNQKIKQKTIKKNRTDKDRTKQIKRKNTHIVIVQWYYYTKEKPKLLSTG